MEKIQTIRTMQYSKNNRRTTMLEWWKESASHPFQSPDDIPDLPMPESHKEWQDFFVPILIQRGAIAKKDLVVGGVYEGSCRNTNRAIWDGKHFVYFRSKFGYRFIDSLNHFEDDNGFDLFVPIKFIEKDTCSFLK